MIEKRNGKYCVVHGHPKKPGSKTDKPEGSVIKCFDTLAEAEKMHKAIIISQQKQKEFVMTNEWIEIFKGGKQIDSGGVEHDGDALIDNAVRLFNAKEHEPPVVIGHPKDNHPAWGWVEGLRSKNVNGAKVLEAKFKDVQEAFANMVNAGQFKKRSAAFYPDGSLRHVGFLGATPPAVKGLADVKFKESDSIEFEFTEPRGETITGDSSATSTEIKIFKEGGEIDMTETQAEYGEKTASKDVEKQETKIDFSEALKAQETKLRAEFAEKLRKQAIEHYVDKHFPPAFKDAGITEFMQSLKSDEIQFAEAKQTPEAWFKEFMQNIIIKFNLFNEFATADKAKADTTQADEDAKIAKDIAARVSVK